MSLTTALILAGLAGLIGIGVGYVFRWLVSLGQKGSVDLQIKQMLLDAREEAKKVVAEAEKKVATLENELREELRAKEEASVSKEERLGQKEQYLDKRQLDIDKEAERIKGQIEEIKKIKERADALLVERQKAVEGAAKLTEEEAKEELLKTVEKNHEEDMLVRIQKLEIDGKERLEAKAREILTTAIHRMGNSVHAEVLTTAIPLPNEELKGKIIGKEGRNIRAFERATGVDVLVDD